MSWPLPPEMTVEGRDLINQWDIILEYLELRHEAELRYVGVQNSVKWDMPEGMRRYVAWGIRVDNGTVKRGA